MLPKRIVVTAVGAYQNGLAIRLKFKMQRKNDYYYTVFLDEGGQSQVYSDQLLKAFDQDRKLFLMDYADPREYLTGEITAEILKRNEIEDKIKAFHKYKRFKELSFPEGYLDNLTKALEINDGSAFVIKVEKHI